MIIAACKVYMVADWVYSLKDKRMTVKSLIEKTKNKFNVSIAEIEDNDIHKSIVIGFACVSNDTGHANSMVDKILNFIENNTDAEIIDVYKEIL